MALLIVFLATRLVNVWLWSHPAASFVANDVSYYGYHLHRLSEGATDVMQEYPPPAVWILRALYVVGGGWQTWLPVFAVFMVGLDGAVAASLHRRGNPWASLFWILFTGANGAIVWFRFDLIPAALVAWACLYLTTRPRVSGALVGMGAAIKFWPALLIVVMSAPRPLAGTARRRLLGFLFAGLGLAAASVTVEGLHRNVTPLSWQGERGLQIESVPATWIMIRRTFTDAPFWTIRLSDYNALELFGPGVDTALMVSRVLTVLSLVGTLLLAWTLMRRSAGATSILFAVLAVVLMTIVANKTLSPQYIVWLGGPVAALLLQPVGPRLRRHTIVQAVTLVIVGGLTQYTYPWGAYGIMALPAGSGPETSVLVLRNLILIALMAHAIWLTVISARAEKPIPSA